MLLEKRCDQKWGKLKGYNDYKAAMATGGQEAIFLTPSSFRPPSCFVLHGGSLR
jgi:hypothetical protein